MKQAFRLRDHRRSHGRLFGAVVGLVVLGVAGCGGSGVSSEGSVEASTPAGSTGTGDETEVLSVDEKSGALLDGGGSGLGDVTIASGEAHGVAWRLFVMGTEIEYMDEMLCLETKVEGVPPAPTCSGSLEGAFEDEVPALGFPGVTEGEPQFVYGSLGRKVSRVAVELDAHQPVTARIVGEARAHYVAVLPRDVSPTELVAYGLDGEELARRELLDDEADHEQVEDYEQWCGETERGYECRGSGTGSGTVSESGGVEEDGDAGG